MEDKWFEIIDQGRRREMLDLEGAMIERNPGPLNHERWLRR